uniref:EGF-like domain-containing protein n=1 Tax=Molossus molossus TaxID=27622 RepID=A0A7J8J4L8_MOLMO|nr:hypothetical protein HJG59_018478 [Molossus molossus]
MYSDFRLVSEQFSQSPQKLSFYSWYGNARLFYFRVPPDTVLLHWLLQVSQGGDLTCANVEITVYFRYGAPPVINPLGTSFPANTSMQPSFLIKMLQSNTSINISHPAPGDWFVAAHLPPSSQKIEMKGFVPTCAYTFQPDMLVVRVVEVSILEPNIPFPQTLLFHPSYLKVSVLVQSDMPSVMRLQLNTGMDSGGSLTISLWVNKSVISNNTLIMVCVNAASPFLSFNSSLNCTTAFFQGYPLSLSTSSRKANLIIPYPETDNWYLSLQLVCLQSPEECEKASVLVETTLSLVPCLNDCGPYGQCLLLRRHGYLYAGCSCKAGWCGWGCSDNSTAQTVAQQRAAALLLTLSNLLFLAPITVSVYRCLLVEASVYAYTMFFSMFYHACDQPGEAVLCILNYDTLQYCDFLGSGVSIWVTILCMAQLKAALKYVLLLLGTLVFAMSLQLNRMGIWNVMGPCLFALVLMVTMWVRSSCPDSISC